MWPDEPAEGLGLRRMLPRLNAKSNDFSVQIDALDQLLESWSSRIGSAKSQDQGCFLAFSQGNASRAAVAITITAGSCPSGEQLSD